MAESIDINLLSPDGRQTRIAKRNSSSRGNSQTSEDRDFPSTPRAATTWPSVLQGSLGIVGGNGYDLGETWEYHDKFPQTHTVHDFEPSEVDLDERSDTLHDSPTQLLDKKDYSPQSPSWGDLNPTTQINWSWEYLMICLTLMSISALVFIFYWFHNHPLPDWPLGLTINALISIIGTFAKGCMMIVLGTALTKLKWQWYKHPKNRKNLRILDRFERVAAGSAVSAFPLMWNTRFHMASLGSLFVVLSATMDSLLQKGIEYPSRSVLDGPATIKRVQSYNHAATDPYNMDYGPQMLDLSMTAAIYQGLFRNPIVPMPFCQTGNCTWDIYMSLALCSQCQDLSTEITRDGNTSARIPTGLELWSIQDAGFGKILSNQINTSTTTNAMNQASYGPDNNMLSLSVMSPTQAYQCSLYWCVHKYNTSVTNGQLEQEVLETWDSTYMNTKEHQIEIPQNGVVGTKVTNTTFGVDLLTNGILSEYLRWMFNGSSPVEDREPPPNQVAINVLGGWGLPSDNGSFAPHDLNLSFIPDIMTNVTKSISSRMLEVRGSEEFGGYAYRNEKYIETCWPWIILPLGLPLVSSLFFLVVRLCQNDLEAKVAKASSIQIMSYHPGEQGGSPDRWDDKEDHSGVALLDKVLEQALSAVSGR